MDLVASYLQSTALRAASPGIINFGSDLARQ